jgi:hypothetical protein
VVSILSQPPYQHLPKTSRLRKGAERVGKNYPYGLPNDLDIQPEADRKLTKVSSDIQPEADRKLTKVSSWAGVNLDPISCKSGNPLLLAPSPKAPSLPSPR